MLYLFDQGQSEGGSDLYGHGGQSNCSPLPDQEHTPNPDHTDALKSATPPPGMFDEIQNLIAQKSMLKTKERATG